MRVRIAIMHPLDVDYPAERRHFDQIIRSCEAEQCRRREVKAAEISRVASQFIKSQATPHSTDGDEG